MTCELYIYYRAADHQAQAVRCAVTDMQAALRQEIPGLRARLLRRCDAAEGLDTWMETYSVSSASRGDGVSNVVKDALRSAIEQRAAVWAHLISGVRHVEVFEPCA